MTFIQDKRLYRKLGEKIDNTTGSGVNRVIDILNNEMSIAKDDIRKEDIIAIANSLFKDIDNKIWKKRAGNFLNYLYFKKRYK